MAIPAPSPPSRDPDRPDGSFIRPLIRRMIGAARLDARVYEEVEASWGATMQAGVVVVLSSIASGLGARVTFNGLVVGVLASLFLWYVWALVTWWLGTRFLPEPSTNATQDELMRTLGFASTPGLLQVFGLVPPLRWISLAIAAVWVLAAAVVGVRQALDYDSTARALAVVAIGWLIQWGVLVFILALTRAAS